MNFWNKVTQEILNGTIDKAVIDSQYGWEEAPEGTVLMKLRPNTFSGTNNHRLDQVERYNHCQFAQIPARQRVVIAVPKSLLICHPCDGCQCKYSLVDVM